MFAQPRDIGYPDTRYYTITMILTYKVINDIIINISPVVPT